MEVCGGARKALREAGHQTWRDCKSHSVAGGQRAKEGVGPPPRLPAGQSDLCGPEACVEGGR